MGILDTILGMFGIGQPKVTVNTHKLAPKKGALIEGTVTVVGGRRELPLTGLYIRVVKRTEKTNKEGNTFTDRDDVAEVDIPYGGMNLAPEQELTVPFSIQVPADVEASGGNISYRLTASADVPGWDPSDEKDLTVQAESAPEAAEDHNRYHVLPEERKFRHSSVRGDFRLHRLPDGFLAAWKTQIICRNEDGSERWRVSGWGREASVSPDGSRIAVSDKRKRFAFLDPATGDVIGEPIDAGIYVDSFAWLADGRLGVAGHEHILLCDGEGKELSRVSNFEDGREDPERRYLSTVTDTGEGAKVIYMDANDDCAGILDLDSGEFVKRVKVSHPREAFHSSDGAWIVTHNDHKVTILDRKSLETVKKLKVPGKQGVRFVGQSEHSYNCWKIMPRLSPDKTRMLANDESGLLWLMDVEKGEPIRVYTRDVVDFVEDSLWLDDGRFLALGNDGHVRGMTVEGAVLFDQVDVQ